MNDQSIDLLKDLKNKFDTPAMIEIKHVKDETALTRLLFIQTAIIKKSIGNILFNIVVDSMSFPIC